MKIFYIILGILVIIAASYSILIAIDQKGRVAEEPKMNDSSVQIEEATEVEEPEENVVIEIPEENVKEEPKEQEKIENIIYIRDGKFEPENITIYKGETIEWVTDVEKISDDQPRKIACYDQTGYRIFMGERLITNNEKSVFKFEKAGDYVCQEFIYGLRGSIKVKSIQRPAITGAVIGADGPTSLLPLGIVALLIVSLAVYSKRKHHF